MANEMTYSFYSLIFTIWRQGLYVDAKIFYLAARKRFVRLDDKIWLTMCENNLAVIYAALNDFRKAEKLYAKALQNAREAKMLVTEAEIESEFWSDGYYISTVGAHSSEETMKQYVKNQGDGNYSSQPSLF